MREWEVMMNGELIFIQYDAERSLLIPDQGELVGLVKRE